MKKAAFSILLLVTASIAHGQNAYINELNFEVDSLKRRMRKLEETVAQLADKLEALSPKKHLCRTSNEDLEGNSQDFSETPDIDPAKHD